MTLPTISAVYFAVVFTAGFAAGALVAAGAFVAVPVAGAADAGSSARSGEAQKTAAANKAPAIAGRTRRPDPVASV